MALFARLTLFPLIHLLCIAAISPVLYLRTCVVWLWNRAAPTVVNERDAGTVASEPRSDGLGPWPEHAHHLHRDTRRMLQHPCMDDACACSSWCALRSQSVRFAVASSSRAATAPFFDHHSERHSIASTSTQGGHTCTRYNGASTCRRREEEHDQRRAAAEMTRAPTATVLRLRLRLPPSCPAVRSSHDHSRTHHDPHSAWQHRMRTIIQPAGTTPRLTGAAHCVSTVMECGICRRLWRLCAPSARWRRLEGGATDA